MNKNRKKNKQTHNRVKQQQQQYKDDSLKTTERTGQSLTFMSTTNTKTTTIIMLRV